MSKPKGPRTEIISIRVPCAVHDKIIAMALENKTFVQEMVIEMIKDALKKHRGK